MAPKRARDTEQTSKQPYGKRRKGTEDAPAETDPAAQEASVKAYMFHAVKLLNKALKKSRTFETQKLARKLKQTKEPKEGEPAPDAAVVADLEAQLATLKALPIDPIVSYILSTRLAKLPFLRDVAFLPAIISSLPTFPAPSKAELDPTTTDGKARNRTLANKAVKEAWDEVSRAVAKRMGEEVEERKEKEKPVQAKVVAAKPVVAAVPEVQVDGVEVVEGEPKPEKRLSKRAERAAKGAAKALLPKPTIKMDPSRMAALAAASDSDGEESEDEGPLSGSDFGGDDDDEVARELARLGGSGSEGEWSGSEAGDQSDADDSGDEGFASDSSFPAVKPEKARKMKQASSSKPITSSSFLPTLAGGYISYSDSDGEDAKWVKDAEKGEKKERKNRRGQRARQAIWEKKYGSGANHVVKTTGGVAAASKGKEAKKSKKKKEEEVVEAAPFDPRNAPGGSSNVNAQPLGVRKVVRPTITYQSKAPIVPVAVAKIAEFTKPSAPSPARGGPGGRPVRGGPPPPPKPAPSRVEEGMHPSWEAKRRAQEALANLAAAPKGKKITFD